MLTFFLTARKYVIKKLMQTEFYMTYFFITNKSAAVEQVVHAIKIRLRKKLASNELVFRSSSLADFKAFFSRMLMNYSSEAGQFPHNNFVYIHTISVIFIAHLLTPLMDWPFFTKPKYFRRKWIGLHESSFARWRRGTNSQTRHWQTRHPNQN